MNTPAPNLADLPGHQSPWEEVGNAATHGIGAALGIAALAVMVTFASFTGDPWKIVAVSIYGASLVLLFGASTIFHAAKSPKLKHVFWILDHAAIYLLIAGTYTPFCLVTIRGGWGWSLFGVVWGLALVGIIYKAIAIGRYPWLSIGLYLTMGWAIVIAVWPIIQALPLGGLLLMALGGLLYTGGVVFFAWHSLKYHHVIWHLFVLAAAVTHFLAVTWYVIPA